MAQHRMASDHLRIDERSIALHRAVVAKIRQDPRLLDIPRANLQRLEDNFSPQDGTTIPRWLQEWKAVLANPDREEIFCFLVSTSEKACRLRQSSPFSGILTARERWAIYETFTTGAHHTGSE
jgi:hypothetical protein